MRLRFSLPRVATSTVETGRQAARPVLDGSDVVVANVFGLPPHTVALVGRPAVWFSLDLHTPELRLGPLRIPAWRHIWEQDFGGHLFIAVTGADAARVAIVEAGPRDADDALVPFAYPEDTFARKGIVDFAPIVIAPPNGLSAEFFAQLVLGTQRTYDGNQRYTAIEIPFLRVGRDSNSYAVGVLVACGVDPRDVPRPVKSLRFEWFGYPGVEDPVHRSNFGAYLGPPGALGDGVVDVAYHDADGSVRVVVVGGAPNGRATLPSGDVVTLDARGRIAFAPPDAARHGLPTRRTAPPAQIAQRAFFPPHPAPAGNEITILVDGVAVPLARGTQYTGRVVARNEAVSLVTLRTRTVDVVLPIVELGAEMRDPKRVDRLFRVGTSLTVGLHADRTPKLVAHGSRSVGDALSQRRFHAPSRRALALWALGAGAAGALAVAVRGRT